MSIVNHPLNVLVDGGLGLGTNMLLFMDFSFPEVVLLRLSTERKNNKKKKIKTNQNKTKVLNKLELQRFAHC